MWCFQRHCGHCTPTCIRCSTLASSSRSEGCRPRDGVPAIRITASQLRNDGARVDPLLDPLSALLEGGLFGIAGEVLGLHLQGGIVTRLPGPAGVVQHHAPPEDAVAGLRDVDLEKPPA